LSDNSRVAFKLATDTRKVSESLGSHVSELSQLMEAQKSADHEFAATLCRLNELAQQLNMLAINAAIQTSHSGNDSAGFAVVTDEMRRLAPQCAAIAEEASTRIKAVSRRGERSVELCATVGHALVTIQTNSRQIETHTANIVQDLREPNACVSHLQLAIGRAVVAAQKHTSELEKTEEESKEFLTQSERQTEVVLRLQQLVSGSFTKVDADYPKARSASPRPKESDLVDGSHGNYLFNDVVKAARTTCCLQKPVKNEFTQTQLWVAGSVPRP
jgi:methyl-accepting chemotaxis protein